MTYAGGKGVASGQISRFLESIREQGQAYLEPFLGTASVMAKMKGRRYGYDVYEGLVNLMQAWQRGWRPDIEGITDTDYRALAKKARAGQVDVTDPLVTLIGHSCSFAGTWYRGFARDSKSNDEFAYFKRGIRVWNKKFSTMPADEVTIGLADYRSHTPSGLIIYCDPPFAGTCPPGMRGRGSSFNSEEFWEVARMWTKTNTVVISEKTAPSDFVIVKALNARVSQILKGDATKEVLWAHESQANAIIERSAA